MKDAFDAWIDRDDPSINIRLFTEIVKALFGAEMFFDVFGNVLGEVVTIDSDGEIAVNDVLQICDLRSPYNVAHHAIDDLLNVSNFPWFQRPEGCSKCDIKEVCKSGHPAHRFDGTDFSKPTVYCDDLKDLIRHIARRMSEVLGQDAGSRYPRLLQALEVAPSDSHGIHCGAASLCN